jgi:major pilin subunit PapA
MKKRLLFMIKSVIAGAVAMAVVSFGVNAAPTIPQGQGKVTFNGTVVDAPCSISQKSADQSIDFGQLSKSFLEAGGTSKPMDLDIELVNCDITAFKQGQALMNPLMIFIKIIRGFIRTQYKSKTKSPRECI